MPSIANPFSGFAASDYSSDDVSSSAIIMEPIQGDGTAAFFFFLPGALTPPQDYLPLLHEVQAQSRLRLWVAILDPGAAPFPSAAMIEASFHGVLERVKKLGFPVGVPPSKNVVFGGHSMGSWEARGPARKHADAFIQLGGSFHTSSDNLVQYARPVLTLSGALDGQITNAAIAKHAGEVAAQKHELGDYFVHAMKPVILIPGMNHAQFSHGIPNIDRGDFVAEISNEQARQVSSCLISSFLTAHICKERDIVASAIAVLGEAVSQTQKQYKVFWEAMEDPGRDVRKMQLKLAANPTLTKGNVGLVDHDYLENFQYSEPWIHADPECSDQSKRIVIHTFFSPVGTFAVLSDLWGKFMLSGHGEAAGAGAADAIAMCGASFNEKTFQRALAQVPEGVRRKYEERGKKLRFVKDKVMRSHEEWMESELSIEVAAEHFADVQSTAFVVPMSSDGGATTMHSFYYVKLLTPARACSWIYEDGFR